jgi:hypothetical protein
MGSKYCLKFLKLVIGLLNTVGYVIGPTLLLRLEIHIIATILVIVQCWNALHKYGKNKQIIICSVCGSNKKTMVSVIIILLTLGKQHSQ